MGRVLPILFNGDMVRAILDGRKTVTRRVIPGKIKLNSKMEHKVCLFPGKIRKDRGREIKEIQYLTLESFAEREAPYQKGDILYVRETYCPDYFDFITQYGNRHGYKADYDAAILSSNIAEPNKWVPSIHMPREAARIWLEVINIRVERLQDMTLDDFLSEGVVIRPEAFNDPENAYMRARNEFVGIWDSTIKKKEIDLYGWDGNPWVWVIEFERCGKPE